MTDVLVTEMKDQFQRQWTTIRETIRSVPEDQWCVGVVNQLVPARLLYHVLSGVEVYARSTSYEVYLSTRQFSDDWETMRREDLPDQRSTLGQVDRLETAVADWLEGLGDGGLLAPDEGFPWTGSRKIGRAVYLLRHTQSHVGELNSELRRRGLPRGKWH